MSTLKTNNLQHPTSATANIALDNSGNVTVGNNAIIQAGTAAAPSVYPTGDSNTGIYSPGADRIGFSTGGTQRGEFDASGNFQFNSGYGSVATAYGCRAWVSFDGTGTVAIRQSGGVSSITDRGVGAYTVNLSITLPDTSGIALTTCTASITGGVCPRSYITTTTAVQIDIAEFSGGSFIAADPSFVENGVFR